MSAAQTPGSPDVDPASQTAGVRPPITPTDPELRIPVSNGSGQAPGSASVAARILLGAAVAVTLMLVAVALGTRLDDSSIDDHRAVATATVLTVSPLRTGIEFVNAGGVTVRPPGGVLYPGLLSVGQRFLVEYSTLDPTVVRVAGRTAEVGNLLIALSILGTWTVAAPLIWLLRSRARRARNRPASEAPGQVPAAG